MSFCWFSGSTVRMLIRVVTFFRYLYGRVHDVLHSREGRIRIRRPRFGKSRTFGTPIRRGFSSFNCVCTRTSGLYDAAPSPARTRTALG
jgi:hypothetical protein